MTDKRRTQRPTQRPPQRPPQRPAPRRTRTAFSTAHGPTRSVGDRDGAELLEAALRAEATPGELPLTHGFHSYPARFHPLLVRTLLEARNEPPQSVLDPFCGSGTTLIEAARLGCKAYGVDANPLAIELSQLKVRRFTDAELHALMAAATEISEESLLRVKQRARPGKNSAFDDPQFYDPHVYLELAGLCELIRGVRIPVVRQTLLLVLSSLVTKFSRKESDTSTKLTERRIGKGLPSKFFVRKTAELAERLAEFRDEVPPSTPAADIKLGDARALTHVKPGTIECIVTSPPYLGTYDYTEHHARRFDWLGFDDTHFAQHEIGARRRTKELPAAEVLKRCKKT